MTQEIISKAEEIVDSCEYPLRIEYSHDGFHTCKFKIFSGGEERSLGKLIFNPEQKNFIYKKYDNGSDDVFFLSWAVISNLRLRDKIEIAERTDKKNYINRYGITVRQLCEKADFVNLKFQGWGLQILLKKENAKIEKMKFNITKKIYEIVK